MPSVSSLDPVRPAPSRTELEPPRGSPRLPRTISVGLLGYGSVGEAVARLAADDHVPGRGWRFRIAGALVRDTARVRRAPLPEYATADAAAFLRRRYDVVIEALGAIEPARTLVSRLLGQGVPVVTANKALVAAHGRGLAALAALNGTTLRFEASALAGVPFLGALSARPLVSDLDRCAAVVNGTSNFILSKIESTGCSLEQALDEARALGLTEPDASRDLDGHDAADKLVLLASLFGWGRLPAHQIDVSGIRGLTPLDFRAARELGATIKPLAWASKSGTSVSAFVGPALVPSRHPLAALHGALSGIQLGGRFVSNLFFSGPGAGPDVTAATLLDDAIESVSSVPSGRGRSLRAAEPIEPSAPLTDWFVRATFPGLVPDAATLKAAFAGFGLEVRHVTQGAGDCQWLLIGCATREAIARAEAGVRDRHRIRCVSWRAIRSQFAT